MKKYLLVFLICFLSKYNYAQSLVYNPSILKHYSASYLDSLRQSDFGKFSYLVIQYTASFKMDTAGHAPGTFDASYIANFNIGDYEHNRLYNDRFIRDYDKYGFKLTLMSIREMNDLVNFFIRNPALIDYVDSKPPVLVNTGNPQADQVIFRKKNEVWHRFNL
ncbi:MAG: hypothetical protein JST26_01575 [Bacteroidetes bacterium]|nr:hypothetical protein [Bacteroidota bacterium]